MCLVTCAEKLGLLEGSPVGRSWCLSYWRDLVTGVPAPDGADPRLTLWHGGRLTVKYAPWDWVNPGARIMLVGITPGAHQAAVALLEARARLRQGFTTDDALRHAAAAGSFAGPTRRNLVEMLDGVGFADALSLDSTARLFDSHQHLAALCSAIDYPVFVDGRNYGGASPPLTRHSVLISLVKACLGTRIRMTPGALVVPLGRAASDAVLMLITDGLVSPGQCLIGIPHPSGRNGHRLRQYAKARTALAHGVSLWAASNPQAPVRSLGARCGYNRNR